MKSQSVKSLKVMCFMVMRRNAVLKSLSSWLKDIPQQLLLQLCAYLSPYGLQLVEDNSKISGKSLDIFWLHVPAIPPSYILKRRRRTRISVESRKPSAEEDRVTHQQFYYNALLSSIVNMMQPQYKTEIGACIDEVVTVYYTKYPSGYLSNFGDATAVNNDADSLRNKKNDETKKNLDFIDVNEFLSALSRFSTELPVTFPCAKNLTCSMLDPVLRNVTKLSCNLRKVPDDSPTNLFNLMQHIATTNKNLHSLRIQFNNLPLNCSEQDFLLLWQSLYNAKAAHEKTNYLPSDSLAVNTKTNPSCKNVCKMLYSKHDSSEASQHRTNIPRKRNANSREHSSNRHDILFNPMERNIYTTCIHETGDCGGMFDSSNGDRYKPLRKVPKIKKQWEISSEDLYDLAFEPLRFDMHTVHVDSSVVCLDITFGVDVARCFKLISPALSRWKRLRSLELTFRDVSEQIEEEDFSNLVNGFLEFTALEELSLSNFDCTRHSKSIARLSRPSLETKRIKTESQNTQSHHEHKPRNILTLNNATENEFQTLNSHAYDLPSTNMNNEFCKNNRIVHLISLKLDSCIFPVDMLKEVLADEDYYINSPHDESMENQKACSFFSQACVFRGLTHLSIVWYDNYPGQMNCYLANNLHLKELCMKFHSIDESAFLGLINVAGDHTSLNTLDLSSSFMKLEPDLCSLTKVFSHPSLTQLNLYACFSSGKEGKIFSEIDFRQCQLVTLILSKNGLGNYDLDALSQKFSDLTQFIHLRNLDLSSNLFDVNGVQRFFEAIVKARRRLNKVDILGPKVTTKDLKNLTMWEDVVQLVNRFVSVVYRRNGTDNADHVSVM